MKIEGTKGVFSVVILVWLVAPIIPIVAWFDDPDNLGATVFCIFLAVSISLSVTFVAVKEALTYYTLDENSITEHFLSRTRTFRWDECRFIKKIKRKYYGRISDTIVCSKSGLPVHISERKICSYQWPEKNTMFIVDRSDEIYQEFLTWCGGERDIRE